MRVNKDEVHKLHHRYIIHESGGVYVPCTCVMYLWWSLCTLYIIMYLWWSLCTLYIYYYVPLVEFMYLVHLLGCASGGVYVPCAFIRMYLWWSLCTLYIIMYLWWSLCTLYIYYDVPLVEFYVPCTCVMYLWWSLCTLYIYYDVPLVELMYLVHV